MCIAVVISNVYVINDSVHYILLDIILVKISTELWLIIYSLNQSKLIWFCNLKKKKIDRVFK